MNDPLRSKNRFCRHTFIHSAVLAAVLLFPASFACAQEGYQKEKIQKEYYPDRKVKVEWRYIGGELNGESRFYNPDGTLAQTCEYKSGQPEGLLRKFYPDGSLESEAPLVQGKFDGTRKSFYPGGKVRDEANFKNGLLNGEAKQYFENGNLKNIEMFENDAVTGTKKTYFESGQLLSESCCYEAGVLNGTSKFYYESGQLEWNIPFVNGKIHGTTQAYYPSGAAKASVQYREDLWNGRAAEFYESGAKLSEADFAMGSGSEKRYYETGELKEEISYIQNMEDGTVKGYYKTGSPDFVDEYKKGEKLSRQKFDPDGKLMFKAEYGTDPQTRLLFKMDRPEKSDRVYADSSMYSGGWIKSKKNYKDGVLHGTSDEYYDGQFKWVHFRELYWNGTLLSRTEFDPDGRPLHHEKFADVGKLILSAAAGRKN